MTEIFKRALKDKGVIFIVLRVAISAIVGLLGSTAVLSFLNKYAFYNYIIAQGGQTPTSTITSIDFFVGGIAILLVCFSIIFGAGFILLHGIVQNFLGDKDKKDGAENGKHKKTFNQPKLIGMSFLISVLLFLAYFFFIYLGTVEKISLSNFLQKVLNLRQDVVFNIIFFFVIFLFTYILGVLEKFRSSEYGPFAFVANAFWILPPALANLVFLVLILINMFNQEKYEDFLNAIRHGGNMEVEICFKKEINEGVNNKSCNTDLYRTENTEEAYQVLIAKTDTEIVWKFSNENKIYNTNSDAIDTLIINIVPNEEDKDTKDKRSEENNVYVIESNEYGDLLRVLSVFMPMQLTIPRSNSE